MSIVRKIPVAAFFLVLILAACSGGNRTAPPILPQSADRFTGTRAPVLGTRFAVLASDLQAKVHLESGAEVSGNVGVAAPGGSLQLEEGSAITGAARVLSGTRVQNHGTIAGGVTIDPVGLILATAHAVAVSEYDANLAPTIPSPATIDLSANQSLTIAGAGTPGTVNVLELSAVEMAQGSTLTFTAPAGSSFVINVAGEAHSQQFAQVLVSGGISAGDVVFNFTGLHGDVHLEQGVVWNASILALGRQNQHLEKNSVVGGAIVAGGQNLHLEQNAQVQDTVPSALSTPTPTPIPSVTPSPTPTPVPNIGIVQTPAACTGPPGTECTLPSNPSNGDLVLIWGTFGSSNCTATDSNGKALTLYYVSPSSAVGSYTCIFHYTVTGSPSSTYHIAPLAGGGYNAFAGVMELSNAVPANASRATLSWTAASGSTPNIASLGAGGFSLCYNQPYGFAAASNVAIDGVPVSGFTNGTGFYSSADGFGLGGYYLNSAPISNYNCSFTNSANAGNLSQAILLSYNHGPAPAPTPTPTPTAAPSGISIVQNATACTGPAGAECALPSNPANGDLVLIWGTFGSPSCTANDSNGNALSAYYVSPSTAVGSYTCIFHYTVAGSPNNTYHVTPLAGGGYNVFAGIMELSNTVPANAASTTLSWTAASGSTPNIASLGAGGFSLCYTEPYGVPAASNVTIDGVAVSGFSNGTGFYNSTDGFGLGGYYLNAAPISNYNCSFTNSANAGNLSQAILLSYGASR